jgi:hypothetical protein
MVVGVQRMIRKDCIHYVITLNVSVIRLFFVAHEMKFKVSYHRRREVYILVTSQCISSHATGSVSATLFNKDICIEKFAKVSRRDQMPCYIAIINNQCLNWPVGSYNLIYFTPKLLRYI